MRKRERQMLTSDITHARWESMTAEERAERCKHLLPYTQDKNVHAKAGQTRRARDYYNVYEPDTVTEYSDEGGTMQELAQYRNLSGLPIHYTSGVQADYSCYGRGIASALIPIVDELESLLSKASDAVTTLSLNPLAVATGQRIDAKIDRDLVGACVNLEEGGNFGFASASIDYNTVKLLIEQLCCRFPGRYKGRGTVCRQAA